MNGQGAQWVGSPDVLPMFPTLLWKAQLKADFRQTMDAKIVFVLQRLRQDALPLTPGQGWPSHQELHKLKELQDPVSCVERMIRGVLCFLRIGHDAFEITDCWATILARALNIVRTAIQQFPERCLLYIAS